MKVLILAAGYGTRLYPLIKDTPKALLEIKGRPIIDYLLDKVEGTKNLNEIIVVTNEKFYLQLQDWAEQKKTYPCAIRIVNDGTKTPDDRLGSIGDIDFTLKQSPISEDLIVMGGDNLFDFNIKEFIGEAKKRDAKATVGLYDIQDIEKAKVFGVVSLDDNKKVTSFEEKPAAPKSTLVAMCLYYFPKETFGLVEQYLKKAKGSDTAGGYIRWLVQKQDVYGHRFEGTWYDIGSIEAYNNAQEHFQT